MVTCLLVVVATDSVCNGTIFGYGIIKYPDYQDLFSYDVNCWWTLQAYVAAEIFLRIRHFSTSSTDDSVTFSDSSGFQHSLSAQNLISNFTLSSPANISFIADGVNTDLRFEIEFNSIPRFKDSNCGGSHLGRGIIKSPNYPSDYSNNVSCTWTLESYNATHIYLQILNFSTVSNSDFLLITDASRFQLSLSGLQQQRNFTLSSPAVITFITDFSDTAQGFAMEFSSIALAQGSVSESPLVGHGIIMSPNYPENYPKNASQVWYLRANEETDIFLQIRNFSTTFGSSVSVIDYFGFRLLLSGQQPPRNFTLSSYAVIEFNATGVETAHGFEMEFTSRARSQVVAARDNVCGGTMVGYGIIKSPIYQERFYTNVSCWWELRAFAQAHIFLRIRHFISSSNYEFVTISDASGFKLRFTKQNSTRNFTLFSPANISFITHGILTDLRFEIDFSSVARSKDSVCSASYLGHGIIKYPKYERNYFNNVSCTWTLESYNADHIYLQIRNFSTEKNYDFLLITDASRFQLSLSGLQKQRNITLSSPAVITFVSDFTVTAQGFEMEFSSIALAQDSACGGTIVGYGVIKSPNYPENYSRNASCLWTLEAYDAARVLLQIRILSVEWYHEFVTIQDLSGFNLWLSGQQPPCNLTLSSPVKIFFAADRDVTANGFEIEFSSKGQNEDRSCGDTMVGHGLINSTNYPEKFFSNMTCLWTLRAYDAADIFLQIRRFSTKSDYDVVLITDASGYQLPLFGKQQPQNVTLSSPANISFVTGAVVIAHEFEMEFHSILQSKATSGSCGGTIVGYGIIQPPKNQEKNSNNIRCLWTLLAYGADDIFLQIRSFSAESGDDFVVIADASGIPLMLSGQQQPRNVTFSSPANISFQAGNFLTGPDFELAFSSIPRLNAQSGAENDYRLTVILSSVIPLLFIFGAVAVTIGVLLSRKKRIYPEIVSVSTKRNTGAKFTPPPPVRQVAERIPEPTYASLGNIGDDLYDNIYDEIVYRSHGSTSSD